MGRNFWGIAWGTIFIVVGVLMILDRMHMIYFDLGRFLSTWWPLILVIIGLGMIVDHSSRDRKRKDI
jgi:hypothetical protein